MAQRIISIPVGDPWWQDLATPIMRDELLNTPTLLEAYDIAVANPVDSQSDEKTVARDACLQSDERTVVCDYKRVRHVYTIIGRHQPTFIYAYYDTGEYTTCEKAKYYIDARLHTRYSLFDYWIDEDMGDDEYSHIWDEEKYEIARRNRAAGFIDDEFARDDEI